MALSKVKALQSGVSASYHRIGRFTYDGSNIDGEVHSYIDQAAKNSGKRPLEVTSFSIPASSGFQSTKLTPYEYIYKFLMESEGLGFSDSTKV